MRAEHEAEAQGFDRLVRVIAVLAEHTTPEHSNLHNLDNLATLLRCSARGVAFDQECWVSRPGADVAQKRNVGSSLGADVAGAGD